MHLRKETTLQGGKYRIESVLGQGGFGITYMAVQTNLKRKVAIKEFFMSDLCIREADTMHVTVPSEYNKGRVSKFKEKFLKEAYKIASLDNPHIIRIHDVFEENDTAYYVMECIDGWSLSEVVESGKVLSEKIALVYIRQVAEALAEVHAHNLLHLDIKPSNIMVDSKGRAVLIDFGISIHVASVSTGKTQISTSVIGSTPGYAPREQKERDGSKLTPATDIYALGATLYRLLSGAEPLPASFRENGNVMKPLPSSVSSRVREAVEAAMELDESRRPQSVGDFLSLLDGGGPLPPKPFGWSRVKVLSIMLALLSVLGLGVYMGVNVERLFGGAHVSSSPLATTVSDSDSVATSMARITLNGVDVCSIPLSKPIVLSSVPKTEKEASESLSDVASVADFRKAEEEERNHRDNSRIIGSITAVDLGLPSGTLWADRNVGAGSPEDYGDYFAWGETSPKFKYNDDTYIWSKQYGYYAPSMLTKYCTDSDAGTYDNKIRLDLSDDAAFVNMGSSWRMPTKAELEELVNSCTWTRTTQNSVNGSKVTGPNGNSMFIPASGFQSGDSSRYETYGYLWSSSLSETTIYAWCICFKSVGVMADFPREQGLTVRAVVR